MIRYHARVVLPVVRPPIVGGTVVEHGGRIVYVGARADAPPGHDVDVGDVVLMPGLVNAHSHLELTGFRGLLEDLEFHLWIRRLIQLKQHAFDRASLLDAARLGVAEGVRAGITTFADTCESGVAAQAMREIGVRGIMYQEVFGPAPDQHEGALRDVRARIDAERQFESTLVQIGISPHAPFSVSDALFAAVAEHARAAQLPMAVHIAESDAEQRYVVEGSGPFAESLRARGIPPRPAARSPIDLLARTGVLDAHPLLIHCVRADATDISEIARTGCPVAHCPASNAKLGHGIAPLMELLGAGIDVGLGSDSVASNNRMDILEESRLAVLMQRARAGRSDTLSAQTALELATIRGARALGLHERIGSLEAGKDADLAAFGLHGLDALADPTATAVFALTGRDASFVTVAGRVLLGPGRHRDILPRHADAMSAATEKARRYLMDAPSHVT